MTDLFSPLTPADRAEFRGAYIRYLRTRDGVPDRDRHAFDVRERFFREIDTQPVRWQGRPLVDQSVFDRNHASAGPERGLDEATLWALCTAKTNRSERYGVEYSFAKRGTGPASAGDADDPHVYVEIEEFYHTRILRDALRTIGVEMEMLAPNIATQWLIRAMVHLPRYASNVLVFCGEIVGVAIFDLLLGKARELFSAQPAVLARVEALFAQIMVDEVGHVHYVRSMMDGGQLAVARRVLPLIARGVFADLTEMTLLFGRERLAAAVRAADVDAAAAPYADRFTFTPATGERTKPRATPSPTATA